MRGEQPTIGTRVHYIPIFGQCQAADIIDIGGMLDQTVRNADSGLVVMRARDWSWHVVRLNADGLTVSDSAYYWAEDGETTVEKTWHRSEQCRAAPAGGGRWSDEQLP